MKVVLALCLLGVANAAIIPLTYSTGATFPFTAGVLPYSAGVIPTTYINPAPIKQVVPVTYQVAPTYYAAAPAPGYIAKTPGSEHIAPLPAGLGYASHHINLAPAPGTA